MRSLLLPLLLLAACGGSPEAPPAAEPAPAEAPVAEAPAAPAVPAPMVDPVIGQDAPPFTLTDADGAVVSLVDLKGKTVVLEWFNPDCPFIVRAHGAEGPLASLPKKWIEKGVAWVAINSSAPGKEGHGVERNRAAKLQYQVDFPILLDEDGAVGRAYAAKNTPTIYVIDPNGKLAYHGGVDNAPRGEPEGGTYQALADEAIAAVVGGGVPANPRTKPYGCGVKYAN